MLSTIGCWIVLIVAERARVFFDIAIGDVKKGRIAFELVSITATDIVMTF